MSERTDRLEDFYKKIGGEASKRKLPPVIESGQGAYLTIDGVEKLNFGSSHYLGLATDPRLIKAAKEAIDLYGIGTGYRTLAGNHKLHVELESAIARFKGTEDAVVFQGGYMTNLGAIQTLIGKEDIVISDELNHASIIDAIALSKATKLIYRHKDLSDLEAKLKEAEELAKEDSTKLIVTDGVFSMDGDLAPIPGINKLAKKYQTLIMVDDAHGEGVLGRGGRGIVDHFGLHGQIDIEVGTLSKAFSVMGGFIAGRRELIEFYKMKARQILFSNALTIPDTAAALEAVRILEESDEPVRKLWDNAKYLKAKFKELGFDIGHSVTPITPVMLGDEEIATEFSSRLDGLKVFAKAIVHPMVAKGSARIRVIPSAAHSTSDLDLGISAFEKVGKELKVI